MGGRRDRERQIGRTAEEWQKRRMKTQRHGSRKGRGHGETRIGREYRKRQRVRRAEEGNV